MSRSLLPIMVSNRESSGEHHIQNALKESLVLDANVKINHFHRFLLPVVTAL